MFSSCLLFPIDFLCHNKNRLRDHFQVGEESKKRGTNFFFYTNSIPLSVSPQGGVQFYAHRGMGGREETLIPNRVCLVFHPSVVLHQHGYGSAAVLKR